MPQPPEPVHDFFARYLANPDEDALRQFLLDLVELEVARIQISALSGVYCNRISTAQRVDVSRAQRILSVAQRRGSLERLSLDPIRCWLTIMGHRLSLERGWSVSGIPALAEVASRRLGLPLEETRSWSFDTLFKKYTHTVLRAQWDYPGLQFRPSQSAAPEAAL